MGEALQKATIISNDKAGFIVNRVLGPILNKAKFFLEEGVGSAEDIGKRMVYGCNHPMGPLALTDLIGLDILLTVNCGRKRYDNARTDKEFLTRSKAQTSLYYRYKWICPWWGS